MSNFDAKKAETELRKAFYLVQDELKVSREVIDWKIQEDVVREMQERRLAKLEGLKKLKKQMEFRFRDYRFEGRIKSLASIFGKHLECRKLMDAFGLRIIVMTEDQAYAMVEWIKHNYVVFEFKDKVKNPKDNGYQDLKLIVEYGDSYMEFIIQTQQMFVNSCTIQAHNLVYPWKYHPAIQELPLEYREVKF